MISPKTRELLASSYYELCDLLKPSPAQPLPPRLPLCPSLPIAAAPSLRMTFRAPCRRRPSFCWRCYPTLSRPFSSLRRRTWGGEQRRERGERLYFLINMLFHSLLLPQCPSQVRRGGRAGIREGSASAGLSRSVGPPRPPQISLSPRGRLAIANWAAFAFLPSFFVLRAADGNLFRVSYSEPDPVQPVG